VAGPVSECVASVVRVPIELIKQRMQVSGDPLRKAALKVYREGGSAWWGTTRVVYRGYAATVTREVPFALVQMTLFETLATQKGWSSIVAGFVAGSIGGVVTTPMDVIKTRLMTRSYAPSALNYRTSAVFLTLKEMRIIWAEGGVRVLFRGGFTRFMSNGVGGSVYLGTHEHVRSLLQGSKLQTY
jgi:solute carrier family 25 S-adenosylmethionine transporter 26